MQYQVLGRRELLGMAPFSVRLTIKTPAYNSVCAAPFLPGRALIMSSLAHLDKLGLGIAILVYSLLWLFALPNCDEHWLVRDGTVMTDEK